MYTTPDIQTRFNCSHQTVKRWVEEFDTFFSPTARPEKNRPRRFTDDDLRVFATIVNMKAAGKVFEDIHAALQAGQRDNAPDSDKSSPHKTAIIAAAPQMVMQLQTRIQLLESELIEERAKRHRAEGREDLLMQLLREAQERIIKLSGNSG